MSSSDTGAFHSEGLPQDIGAWKEGPTRIDGQSNGIRWSLSSILEVLNRHKTGTHVSQSKTVWVTQDVRMGKSAFILIMNIGKEGIRIEKNPGDTLLGKLARKAGDMVLDSYVGAYFGDEFKSLVNLDGSETIDVQGLSDHFILTNYPEIAKRCMSADAVGILQAWRDEDQFFLRGEVVRNVGVLLSESGCLIACQAPMSSEDESRRYADFCSSLAAAMGNGL